MMLYTKAIVLSPDGFADFFDIDSEVLQEDTFAPFMLIICQDNVQQTSVDI